MRARLLKRLFPVGLTALVLMACAAEPAEEPVDDGEAVGTTDDELRSAPLNDKDMVAIETPAGMPTPWEQPDSVGWFDERGKCGPTAMSNVLRLHGIELSPDDADKAGVHWYVGTLQWQIDWYLKRNYPDLDCKVSYPWNGAKALRGQLDAGKPVMVWFNTDGGWTSHWIVAVGHRGSGDAEKVVVMSWGKYYEIPMKKLDDASKWVYGLRHPTVICGKSTKNVTNAP